MTERERDRERDRQRESKREEEKEKKVNESYNIAECKLGIDLFFDTRPPFT